jgi:hypothetical protein
VIDEKVSKNDLLARIKIETKIDVILNENEQE